MHVHNLQGDGLQHTSGQLFEIQPSPIVTSVSEGTLTICEVMDCSTPVLVCFSDGLSTPALSLTHTVGPLCCDKGVSFNLLIVFSAAFNFSLRSVTSCCRWTMFYTSIRPQRAEMLVRFNTKSYKIMVIQPLSHFIFFNMDNSLL